MDFITDVEAYIKRVKMAGGAGGFGLETVPVSVRVHGEYVPEEGWHKRAPEGFNNILSLWSLITESSEVLTSDMEDKQIHYGPIIDSHKEMFVILTDCENDGKVGLEWGGADAFEAEQTIDRETFATEILTTGEEFVKFIETEVIPYCEDHPNTLGVRDIRMFLPDFKEPVEDLANHLGRQPAWQNDS
ncbi:hypothetical protein [Halobacterium jilantaiense]|uniref:hypothetical protein n=1 Tax=Halobacterium jilantaiense TaxID=355548 RepID=UPI0015A4F0C5|nr:hypothetical protein [Halobacterium jilantaiense]